MINGHHSSCFYGVTTVGERGQVVIPAKTRKDMNMRSGEKLLVFGMGTDCIVLSRLANIEKMAALLESRLKSIRAVIRKKK